VCAFTINICEYWCECCQGPIPIGPSHMVWSKLNFIGMFDGFRTWRADFRRTVQINILIQLPIEYLSLRVRDVLIILNFDRLSYCKYLYYCAEQFYLNSTSISKFKVTSKTVLLLVCLVINLTCKYVFDSSAFAIVAFVKGNGQIEVIQLLF
jgi:hypothetical protein